LAQHHTLVADRQGYASIALTPERGDLLSSTSTLDRNLKARRAGCRDALLGRGLSHQLAERWCEAWEAHAVLHRLDRSSEFWQDGLDWIEGRLVANRLRGY
jgi:hypothetical protein